MAKAANPSVDAYITAAPRAAQPKLRQLRRMIRAAAPDAEERISYGMPFYAYHGRLVYFAAFKNHVGVYALVGEKNVPKELKPYMAAKATVQFPLDQPLPVALVQKLVRARVKQNAKAQPSPRLRKTSRSGVPSKPKALRS